MAGLIVDSGDLVVRMSPLEVCGALHGPVRVPLGCVESLDVSESLWEELRGIRLPGTGLPRVIALGTWKSRGAKDFVAVYRRTGVVVTLSGSSWSRLVVSSREPERVRREIDAHR